MHMVPKSSPVIYQSYNKFVIVCAFSSCDLVFVMWKTLSTIFFAPSCLLVKTGETSIFEPHL